MAERRKSDRGSRKGCAPAPACVRGPCMFELLDSLECARVTLWSDPASGLHAVLAVDDVTLGPAVGGIRTRAYASLADAVEDAARLARAMTIKTALAGVDAGGGKIVVI